MDDFSKTGVDPLTVSLYQMDLDRTMFLLRSYLRTRLQKVTMGYPFWNLILGLSCFHIFFVKYSLLLFLMMFFFWQIEKYVFHINKTPELWNRLSKQEQKFANR